MLHLIHGDDVEKTRHTLSSIKSNTKNKEIREVDGKHLDENMLVQSLESPSLFGGDICIIIERYLTYAKKREKSYSRIVDRIVRASSEYDVILYEEKEIDTSTIQKLGKYANVTLHKTPVVLFQFLDAVMPGNTKQSLTLLERTTLHEPPEIVFSLLVKRTRQLMECKDGFTPGGVASWQEVRLTNQARQFTMEQLIAMHTQLLNADIATKTGSTPFTLTQLLEQIILSL